MLMTGSDTGIVARGQDGRDSAALLELEPPSDIGQNVRISSSLLSPPKLPVDRTPRAPNDNINSYAASKNATPKHNAIPALLPRSMPSAVSTRPAAVPPPI